MKSEAAARERKVLSQKVEKQKSSTTRSLEKGGWWRGRGKTTKHLSGVAVHDYNPRIWKAEADGLLWNGGQRVTELHMHELWYTYKHTRETKGKVGSTCQECTWVWASGTVLHKLGVDVNIPSPNTQAGGARESSSTSSSATYRVQAQPGVHETLP